MSTRRIVLLSVIFLLLVAAAPFIDVMLGSSAFLLEGPSAYRLPLKAHPDDPRLPLHAYSERIDWDAFGRLDVPGLVALAYGDFGSRTTYAQVLGVAKSGARFSIICGATCTSTTSPCATGSAFAAFTDSSITKPYLVPVYAGVYNECVVIDNRTDISLDLAQGAIIRPTVVSALDVDGGSVRIAPITTTVNTTTRISVTGGEIWDDAYGVVSGSGYGGIEEAALTLGTGTATPNTQGWNDVYVGRTKIVGNAQGVSIYGTRPSSNKNLPRLLIRDSEIVGGLTGIKHARLMTITNIEDSKILAMSNYCDNRSAADLSEFTGAVVAGTLSTITLQNTAPATNNVLAGRGIVLSGASCPTVAYRDGAVNASSSYDGTTKILTAVNTFGTAPDANCTYTISAVANSAGTGATSRQNSQYPSCTSVGWAQIRAAGGVSSRITGLVGVAIGPSTSAGGDFAGQQFTMRDSDIIVEANDYLNAQDASCSDFTTLGHAGDGIFGIGILAFNAGELIHDATFDNVNVVVNLNTDHQGTWSSGNPACPVAAGLLVSHNAKILGKVSFSGSIKMRDFADPDTGVACVRAQAMQAGSVEVSSMNCDIDRPTTTTCSGGGCGAQASTSTTLKLDATDAVATDGYNGLAAYMTSGACAGQIRKVWDYDTATKIAQIAPLWAAACVPGAGDDYIIGYIGVPDDYDAASLIQWGATALMQENTTALKINNMVSPDLIATTGIISGWDDHCLPIGLGTGGWVAGSDNISIPVSDANVGMQVAYVGCRCQGTCTVAAEALDFEDNDGNQFAAAVACVDNNADMTWTDVRADVDALLPAVKSPRFDTNVAPTVATDNVQVCLRYSTTRFAP
jgi:hypothetical protein